MSYSSTTVDPGADSFVLDAITCGLNASLTGSSFDALTGNGSVECYLPDGPASSNVSITVGDDDTAHDTDTITLAISNVAPTTDFMSLYTEHPVFQGNTINFMFANGTDVSQVDVDSGLIYEVVCESLDPLSRFTPGTGTLISPDNLVFACTYLQPGIFTTVGTVADKDGGFTNVPISVEVLSLADAIDYIENLVSQQALNRGQENSLKQKLDAIRSSLDTGNPATSLNQLGAFINQVEAYIENGLITQEEGNIILMQAELLKTAIQITYGIQ